MIRFVFLGIYGFGLMVKFVCFRWFDYVFGCCFISMVGVIIMGEGRLLKMFDIVFWWREVKDVFVLRGGVG